MMTRLAQNGRIMRNGYRVTCSHDRGSTRCASGLQVWYSSAHRSTVQYMEEHMQSKYGWLSMQPTAAGRRNGGGGGGGAAKHLEGILDALWTLSGRSLDALEMQLGTHFGRRLRRQDASTVPGRTRRRKLHAITGRSPAVSGWTHNPNPCTAANYITAQLSWSSHAAVPQRRGAKVQQTRSKSAA